MPGLIAEQYGLPVQQSRLFFEGGNIVSDSKWAFIGANTIRYNALRWLADEADIVRLFQQELGKRVLVVGPYPQPIGHIDMMLTPLGGSRVALADPSIGASVVQSALQASPAAIARFEAAVMEQFFGHPDIDAITLTDGSTAPVPDLSGRTERMLQLSRDLAPTLDGIAEALRASGFTVERVPFLHGGPGSVPVNDAEQRHAPDMVAEYPMLTYNNVLLETAPEPVVYLPVYGLESLDEAAQQTWRGLGFRVVPVEGFSISSMYGGALRCSVKVLARR